MGAGIKEIGYNDIATQKSLKSNHEAFLLVDKRIKNRRKRIKSAKLVIEYSDARELHRLAKIGRKSVDEGKADNSEYLKILEEIKPKNPISVSKEEFLNEAHKRLGLQEGSR